LSPSPVFTPAMVQAIVDRCVKDRASWMDEQLLEAHELDWGRRPSRRNASAQGSFGAAEVRKRVEAVQVVVGDL
jgi:hypothetical protein